MAPIPDRTFTASYDLTAKIISAFVPVMLVAITVVTHSVIASGFAVLLIVATYAYSPRSYSTSERSIIVERLIGNVRLPLDDLREVRAGTADDFRGCIRLFGNGGLFGYYGLFRTSKLGMSTWYVTNRKNTVVLIAGGKTLVFSPDDVEGFLAGLRPLLVPGADLSVRS
jgi:hypothetical protein